MRINYPFTHLPQANGLLTLAGSHFSLKDIHLSTFPFHLSWERSLESKITHKLDTLPFFLSCGCDAIATVKHSLSLVQLPETVTTIDCEQISLHGMCGWYRIWRCDCSHELHLQILYIPKSCVEETGRTCVIVPPTAEWILRLILFLVVRIHVS